MILNMKYTTRFLSFTILLVLLFSLASCEKKEHDTVSELIIGKWQWIETMSPWTGIKYTPQTEGYTESIEFTSIGIVKQYKNGVLVNTSNYKIEPGPPETDYYVMTEYFGDTSFHIYIMGDTLQYNAAYVDGPVVLYLRTR